MGSFPNLDPTNQHPLFPNERRIEVFYPPQLLAGAQRSVLSDIGNAQWDYGK